MQVNTLWWTNNKNILTSSQPKGGGEDDRAQHKRTAFGLGPIQLYYHNRTHVLCTLDFLLCFFNSHTTTPNIGGSRCN